MPDRSPAANPDSTRDFGAAIQRLIAARWVNVWKIAPRVQTSNDPEHLHELRVASRRLRAAMEVGAECFPTSAFRPLHKIAKRIGSATGELRDGDVQLNALRAARKKVGKPERIGINHLIELIETRRDVARTEMKLFLRKLDDDGARKKTKRLFLTSVNDIPGKLSLVPDGDNPASSETLAGRPDVGAGSRVPGLDPEASLEANARTILRALTADLFRHAAAIPDPARVDELHEARIAAKRLRYTIELFPGLFGDDGLLALEQIRSFQEEAGKVHDLDVRLQLIAGELRSGARPGKRKDRNLQASLLDLSHCTQTDRDIQHTAAAAAWQGLLDGGLEANLQSLAEDSTLLRST